MHKYFLFLNHFSILSYILLHYSKRTNKKIFITEFDNHVPFINTRSAFRPVLFVVVVAVGKWQGPARYYTHIKSYFKNILLSFK